MSSTASNSRTKQWVAVGLPIVLGLAVWFMPVPKGLSPQAWHMFAIFAATIAGILTQQRFSRTPTT